MSDSNKNTCTVRQAFLEAVFTTAVDAIVVINDRGLVQAINPATTVLFGYEEDEVIGMNVSMLMPNPYRDEHDGYLQNYRESGVRKIIGKGREVIGRRKDGTEFPMHLAVSEIEVAGQKMFTGIVRDITDLKEAESQLREMNDELEQRVQQRTRELHEAQAELVRKEKMATLGQVSGGIAHEIRNPLNVVKTSVYYLVNAKNPNPEKIGEHLQRIDRQVSLIDNVVTALSDVARLPDPNLAACDLQSLLSDVTRTTSLSSNVTIDNQIRSDLPHVLIDANQMSIVFRNLIRNARDAMPDGGTITISADLDGQLVQVHVADEGIGIPGDEINKIMEPLYSTKARGMGLGLAISKTIVQKNSGTVSVISTPGEGTTFTVGLPRGDRAH